MATPISTSKNGSTLLRADGTNKTSTAISPNILIYVGNNPVGAIQSISVTESREIKEVYELGFDGAIDSVPVGPLKVTGDIKRIRYDRMRLTEALGRAYIHPHAQRFPFDVHIIDTWNGDGDDAIVTVIKNVWLKGSSYSYSVGTWIIEDTSQYVAETIYTVLKGGPAAQGGETGRPLALQSPTSDIERQTDTGMRRGSMDSPGLLKAFLPF